MNHTTIQTRIRVLVHSMTMDYLASLPEITERDKTDLPNLIWAFTQMVIGRAGARTIMDQEEVTMLVDDVNRSVTEFLN